MSTSRTSSAYTPAQKAKILSRARKLLSEGKSFHHTAQKVGVHRQTLKRWMCDAPEDSFCFTCEAKRIVEKHGIPPETLGPADDAACDTEPTEELEKATEDHFIQLKDVRMTFGEAPKKLSWEEVRELCREYDELCEKWADSNREACYAMLEGRFALRVYRLRKEGLASRMLKIESLIGMDAIREYRERKATRQKIEEAEERCNERIGSLKREVQQLETLTGMSIAFGIGAVLFSMFV